MTVATAPLARIGVLAEEAAKLPAFLRRDALIAWSYRVAFVSDILGLVTQMVVFSFVGKLVETEALPSFGGVQASYIEFVCIGIVVNVFVQVALTRIATAVRTEQLTGTLEALLMTPTSSATVQLGSATFDLVYMPVRTAVFLAVMAAAVGLDLHLSGLAPSLAILLAFIPFVWGIGIATAAAILTFRRGEGLMGVGATLLGLASGAYFPLALLPGWIAAVAEYNPLAVAIEAMRNALLGGTGWAGIGSDMLLLGAMSGLSLVLGSVLFRLALSRERRRGTLGLY
jgi:ABC-2 type transport system permease protein